MEKVASVREGVEKLLRIRQREVPQFDIISRKDGQYLDVLLWNDKQIPLFATRYEQQIRAIANYGSQPEENSALNVYSFVGSDIPLDCLIFRELDIAEYILHSKIAKLTAFINKNAANLIVVMENGTTANLDLGNSMAPGTHNQCQHRLTDTCIVTDVRYGCCFSRTAIPPSVG